MNSQNEKNSLIFRICHKDDQIFYQRNVVQLQSCNRDDSKFKVAFTAIYYDHIGRPQNLGLLRIGMKGMTSGAIVDYLPQEFSMLPDCFFSLGQDEYYYENINRLHTNIREVLLKSLRDMAFELDILEENQEEEVLLQELIRDVAPNSAAAFHKIKGQLHRMTSGSARLTEYSFSYTAPRPNNKLLLPPTLEFSVKPESVPPTNIHALIGRNGCGKTHLIRNMVRCLKGTSSDYGEIRNLNGMQNNIFFNVLCIAFSPFDDFSDLEDDDLVTYVGLNKHSKDLRISIWEDFWKHFRHCMLTVRRKQLWQEAIETLKSDPAFFEEQIDRFADDLYPYPGTEISKGTETRIRNVFDNLSSGHKIVLLIITSCVAEIEERSIVFLDEPETHLHPPLLSALVRALSDLLRDRNGVAIIATHSPVVLQEIPKSCVHLLTRYGRDDVKAERPKRESFGSSLGTLIDEAFAFEVNQSGFHKLMVEAAREYDDFDAVLDAYQGQLGNEASILLRMLMRVKHWED